MNTTRHTLYLALALSAALLRPLPAQTNPPSATTAQETTGADTVEKSKAQKPRLTSAAQPAADAKTLFTIYMIGDSTMANKPVIPAYPERGWGQMLSLYFKSGIRVENHAMNGRSSKSFIDEGRWTPVRESLKPGDWVIIQFGHNDEKNKDPRRYTEPYGQFKTNLTTFITQARAKGAHPILCTAIARRKFNDTGTLEDTHGDYITATRQVAAEQSVPLLDLNKRSDELLRTLGPERSKIIYDWFTTNEFPGLKKNLEDDTHFNSFGASRMCDLAVEEIQSAAPELAKYLNTK